MWSGEVIYFRPPVPCRKRARIPEPSLFVRVLKVFDSQNRPDTGPGWMCGSQNTFGAGSTPICSSLAIDGLHWLRPAANARPECHALWLSGKLATFETKLRLQNYASLPDYVSPISKISIESVDLGQTCEPPARRFSQWLVFFSKTVVTTKMVSHILYIYIYMYTIIIITFYYYYFIQ